MRETLIEMLPDPTAPLFADWLAVSVSPGSTFTHEASEPPRRSGGLGAKIVHVGHLFIPSVGILSPWADTSTWGPGASKWVGWWFRFTSYTSDDALIGLVAGVGLPGQQQALIVMTATQQWYIGSGQDGGFPVQDLGGTPVPNTWAYLQVEILRATALGVADGAVRLFVDAKDGDPPVAEVTGVENYTKCSTSGLAYWGIFSVDSLTVYLEQLKIGTTFNSTAMFQPEWNQQWNS